MARMRQSWSLQSGLMASLLAVTMVLQACGGSAASPPPASAPASKPAPSTAASGAPSSPKPASSSSAAPVASGNKIVFVYTALTAAFASLWVATDEGIFSKHSLQVDPRNMDSNVAAAALISGEVQYSTTPSLVNAILAGSPVTLFARLTNGPVFGLYVTKSITRTEDLRGKIVADTLVGTAPDSAIHDILERHGMKESDVQLIHAPNAVADLAALQSGQASAAILPVPITLQARNAGFVEVTNTVKEGSPLLTASLGAQKSRLKDDPATAKAVIQSFQEATAFMISNPQRTKEIIGKYTKTESTADLDETYAQYQTNWQVGPVRAADVAAALRWLPDPRASAADPNTFFDNSLIASMQ